MCVRGVCEETFAGEDEEGGVGAEDAAEVVADVECEEVEGGEGMLLRFDPLAIKRLTIRSALTKPLLSMLNSPTLHLPSLSSFRLLLWGGTMGQVSSQST